jgi:hypothetical protein
MFGWRKRISAALLGGFAVLVLAAAPTAAAAPTLGLAVTHAPATINRGDEFVKYNAVVTNTSSPNPTCALKTWSGTPAPTFAFQWLRDGVSLGPANGAQTATYTPQPTDVGHSLQCQVIGTNTVSSVTTSTTAISAPLFYGSPGEIPAPAPKEPTAASARPTIAGTGIAERTCTAPTGWKGAPTFTFQWLRNGAAIPSATAAATTASGSTSLTAVATATGSGELTSGSKNVIGVTTATGALRVGQTITATGIPAATTITAVGAGTLELSAAATETAAQSLAAGAQPIAVGDAISGAGIPAGTTVTAISGRTITMSAAATASASGVTVTATATGAKYKPNAATGEEDLNKVLQCQVLGTNSSGNALSISLNSIVGTVTTPPANTAANTPTTSGAEWTSGTTSVSIALPEGVTLWEAAGTGWTCHLNAANCTITTGLQPGASSATLRFESVIDPATAPDTVVAVLDAFGGGAAFDATAVDAFTFGAAGSFGVEAGSLMARAEDAAAAEYFQAGGHPFAATTAFNLNLRQGGSGTLFYPIEDLRDAVVDPPAGFVGNPGAASQCTVADLKASECPRSSAIGKGNFRVEDQVAGIKQVNGVVYRLTDERGYPAEFGVRVVGSVSLVFRALLRSDGDYGVSVLAPLAPQRPQVLNATVTLCGNGAKVERSTLGGNDHSFVFNGCKQAGEGGLVPAFSVPFLTNPTRCAGPAPVTGLSMDSSQHPGATRERGLPDLSDPNWKHYEVAAHPLEGCGALTEAWVGEGPSPTQPSFEFQPGSAEPATPAAYTAQLHVPQQGLMEATGLATSHLRDTTVRLPAGVSLNPSAADGLAACTPAQIGLKTAVGELPAHFTLAPPSCPDAAKIGVVQVTTPLLEDPLPGSVYLASQDQNPFASRFGIYLVIDDEQTGIVAKLPGEVLPDERTGQITARFVEGPQVPFEDVKLSFFGGSRASLANPDTCGEYTTEAEMTPWSAADPAHPLPSEIATSHDPIAIATASASACPTTKAARSFAPSFSAGTTNPAADAHSPFTLRITRPDGNQELDRVSVTTPPGFAATLKGVVTCSWASVDAAAAKSKGADEIAHPSCPASSQVGTSTIGAGVGSSPYYVKTGKAYLTGPYKGAPVSLTFIVPAMAGPFDLGVQVVKTALNINPKTAQVTAVSDPIPQILDGVPLQIRDIRVNLDRSNFALNPTNCEPMAISTQVTGGSGAVANLSNRFQVGNCAALKFHPDLAIQLHGGTKRGDYQRLQATVTYPRKGAYANIARAAVTFPHSAFLAQEHIRTVCTRVQFAAHECPKGSIYGHAEATTPLLDGKLSGPVYLRSSDNLLPDLVVALRGPDSQPIEVELAGRTDSKHGGIRNTFEMVPDAPVSKFRLTLLGGKKSLIVNSRDLCKGPKQRATVRFDAQNGMQRNFRPVIGNDCGKQSKAWHKNARHHGARRAAHRLLAIW